MAAVMQFDAPCLAPFASLLLAVFLVPIGLCGHSAAAPIRVISTTHYRIETDLDLELADDCARRMNVMYDEYASRFSGVVDFADAPSFRVFLFQKRADYAKLVGVGYQNTGGLFVPSRNLLAAVLEGQERDALRRTLQHEAFHQFAHEALPNGMPVWLNEGMAQIFEEGLWTSEKFWIGQVPPRRVRQLQADLKAGRLMDIRALAAMSSRQWADVLADRSRAATQYNQAWAAIHFLMHFKDESGNTPYRPRILKLLQLLHDRVDGAEAFREVFPDGESVNLHFIEYVKRLPPTLEATMLDRQGVLADLLVELHSHQLPIEDMGEVRQTLQRGGYRIRYSVGEVKWESDADVKTYFSDSQGRVFEKNDLRLVARPAGPLPDVVCRCFDKYDLRTRFYQAGGRMNHETTIEARKEGKE